MKRITIEKLALTKDEKEILEKARDILQEIDNETDDLNGCSFCPLDSYCSCSGCELGHCLETLDRIINNTQSG